VLCEIGSVKPVKLVAYAWKVTLTCYYSSNIALDCNKRHINAALHCNCHYVQVQYKYAKCT
jgi:hypothetical protein